MATATVADLIDLVCLKFGGVAAAVVGVAADRCRRDGKNSRVVVAFLVVVVIVRLFLLSAIVVVDGVNVLEYPRLRRVCVLLVVENAVV